ncbi:hypothetical protein PIB30_032603 [Stylosanthes scabra]|uniref:HTH La-type RNA-binding domain-containing protein n=1 Tax=Stylosanthes scabra TaxID=79078 RepID=A0ABU6TCY7_9FABA|nr:hypothetical protein [Stylosanthes scabra]
MAMAANNTAVSPWNQVVRGVESESALAAPSSELESAAAAAESSPPLSSTAASTSPSLEDSCSTTESSKISGNNGPAGKKLAWNKPSSNGGTSEARPVMDADSWPALSESTRVAIKSESSSKGLLDGSSSVPHSQGTGNKISSSSQRQVNDNASANQMVPTPNRPKPFKHNSPNVSSNGGHAQQPAPQALTATTASHYHPPTEHTQRSAFASNDRPQQRNSYRNRNSGPHQRGDGSQHHNYGNRRDQNWNTQRNFNARDPHMASRAGPRFPRPPPPHTTPQFIHPPPVRTFGGHIGFHDVAPPLVFVQQPPSHPNSLRGVPYVTPIPPQSLFYTGPDPQLHTRIVTQINYYFSNENLIKDTFLRQNMDDQGWVPITLIASFNKVMHLTDSIQVILDAVRTSSVVEVQGEKIRRRNDWRRWIIPSTVQFPVAAASPTQVTANQDSLAEQVENITLKTTNNDGTRELDVLSDSSEHKSSHGDFNNPLPHSSGEGTNRPGIQGTDYSTSAEN